MPANAEPLPDVHVAERIRSGDKDAFGQLFKDMYPKLYRFALNYVRIPATAEDILSDVFLRLWASRTTFRPSGSLELYLYGAVRHSVLQHFRSAKAHERRHEDALGKSIVPGMAESTEHSIEDTVGEDPVRAALWNAIAAMPEQRRIIMQLRWREQKSFGEIAQILGMSRPAVQMQVDRALKALRKVLQP